MNSVNLELEASEYDELARYAESLGVSVEDVACTALCRLMHVNKQPDVQREIAEVHDCRINSHMPWCQSAGILHVVEGKTESEPDRSRFY